MSWNRPFSSVLTRSLALAIVLGLVGIASWATVRPTLAETVVDDGDNAPLDVLFNSLSATQSEDEAKPIAALILREWMKSGSDTIDLLVRRAMSAVEDEEFAVALQLLDEVVDLAPGYAEGWNRRATVYFMQRRYDESVADVQRVLALEPRHFGAMSGLGIMLQETGHDAAALEIFRRALQLHPHLPEARKAVDELKVEVEGREI